MKGVVIFDNKSDLAFYTVDKAMETYVTDRINQLEAESGAPSDETGSAPLREMRDCLSAFFLPFFTSFDVLHALKKPIFSITAPDGFLIVFRKFGENVYIAVSKDEGETEETLTKKLFVFNRIVTMLHGPVDSRLNPPDLQARKKSWTRLASLLKTYEDLYLTDQVYLVEALEHVQFGQLQAAANIVQKLTRQSLDSTDNGGLNNVRHAMLLVNTKFLCMCGRSPRIETADILLINLLVYHHFHNLDGGGSDEEELEEATVPNEHEDQPGVQNDTEEEEEEEEEEEDEVEQEDEMDPFGARDSVFHSALSTPIPRSHDDSNSPVDDPPLGSVPRETAVDVEDVNVEISASVGSRRKKNSRRDARKDPQKALPGRVMRSALASLGFVRRSGNYHETYRAPPADHDGNTKFLEQLIFLQTQPGLFYPHMLYCLQVYEGIVLVMVAEHGSNTHLCGSICKNMNILSVIVNNIRGGIAGGMTLYESLDDNMRRIKDLTAREMNSTTDVKASANLRHLLVKSLGSWNNLKQAGLKNLFQEKREEMSLFTRVEVSGSDLYDKLMKLFEALYFSPKERDYNLPTVVSKLSRLYYSLNQDYGEFLALKGLVNIPMVSFSMSFPGMVHFIFIDRSFDELTSPSLAADNQTGVPYVERAAKKAGENPAVFLRRKIWGMVQRVQRFLAQGYTLQTWLDEDFLYTYYLWINVPNNALGAPLRFYSPSNVRCSEHTVPGVIGSSFFSDIHNAKEGYVYELYCLHEANVPIKAAAAHCRQLATQLWPLSREAIAPFSLIN